MALGRAAKVVEVDATVVLVGCPDPGFDVWVAVPVAEAVRDAVGENAGSDVCVAVGVAVDVKVAAGVCVGDFFGFLVLVGLWVGLAKNTPEDVEKSDCACTGIVSRVRKASTKNRRMAVLYFMMNISKSPSRHREKL